MMATLMGLVLVNVMSVAVAIPVAEMAFSVEEVLSSGDDDVIG